VIALSDLNKRSIALAFANSNVDETIGKFKATPKLGRAMYLTALANLYAECGNMDRGKRLFKIIEESNFITDAWISENLVDLRKQLTTGHGMKMQNCKH
jgi:hypothetical protein